MKKIFKKVVKKSEQDEQPADHRITKDTVAEHREQVLAGGRKFKYPMQYARHKLVFNTIIISFVALVLMGLVGWWQLYLVQNTSAFMYRASRVLPLPVAKIDDQPVRYGDYLMKYRSAMHYLENKEQISLRSEDGKRQSDYIKIQSMNDSLADAYALKLAKELNIKVTDQEVEDFLLLQRQSEDGEISASTYDAVIADYYGWSPSEYRYTIVTKLTRQKVAYAIDTKAQELANNLKDQAKASTNFSRLVGSDEYKDLGVSYGSTDWVLKSNQDGGLAKEAAKLAKGRVSGPIQPTTGDGYYFIKLLDINDTQVKYEYIKVELREFNNRVSAAEVKYYIDLPDANRGEG